jgi:hypothetical protein
MKTIFLFLTIILFHINTYCQSNKLFEINEHLVSDSTKIKTINDFTFQDTTFFEDDKYVVRKTCSGEWGGSVWFKNKTTGIEYSCSASCPVVINKIDGNYIVSATLAHLSGSSEIIEIENPDSLDIFIMPKPSAKKGKIIYRYVGDDESRSTKGTTMLLDSIGIQTLASFPYNGQLYHVITDFDKTFLTQVENGRFVTLDTISNASIWTYEPEVIKSTNGHFVVFFNNHKTRGYLDIHGKSIDIFRLK